MASIFSACVYVILRAIGSAKKVHFMQTVTYFGLVGSLVAWIPIVATGIKLPTGEEFMGLSLMAFSAFLAQMMFCKVRMFLCHAYQLQVPNINADLRVVDSNYCIVELDRCLRTLVIDEECDHHLTYLAADQLGVSRSFLRRTSPRHPSFLA